MPSTKRNIGEKIRSSKSKFRKNFKIKNMQLFQRYQQRLHHYKERYKSSIQSSGM